MLRHMAATLLLALLGGCSTIVPVADRVAAAKRLFPPGWQQVATYEATLPVWGGLGPADGNEASGRLTIYLEGDGMAWLNRSTPSNDPTPINPVALRLAVTPQHGRVAYLARPCQFVSSSQCHERYWTEARFSSEVLAAMMQAVDMLKAKSATDRIVLVGYSGGAAIATLLAESRTDVVGLVTVAGVVDHRAWTRWHGLTPLSLSQDPMRHYDALSAIPQRHYVGDQDNVVPPELVRFTYSPESIQVEQASHSCCWSDIWPTILREDAFWQLVSQSSEV